MDNYQSEPNPWAQMLLALLVIAIISALLSAGSGDDVEQTPATAVWPTMEPRPHEWPGWAMTQTAQPGATQEPSYTHPDR